MSRTRLPRILNDIENHNKLLVNKIASVKSSYSTKDQSYKQYLVRENRLDSMFLIRKHKLEQLSKQNQLIHQRIFSQKSTYAFSRPKKLFKIKKQIDHLQEIEVMKKNYQKKEQLSKLSTACQTLCKRQYALSEKKKRSFIPQQSSQLSSFDVGKKKQINSLKLRAKSCKNVPQRNRINDIILV